MSYTPESNIIIRNALISSFQKAPAVALAQALTGYGVQIYASGGTADAIEAEAAIEVHRLERITGFASLLGGRVKTLHPAVHAAILARRDNDADVAALRELEVQPLDLVAVDLYPFPAAVGRDDREIAHAVELIDVGGVALIRAAAKNFRYVIALSQAEQFGGFCETLAKTGAIIEGEVARRYAAEAFRWTAEYDGRIAAGLDSQRSEGDFPPEVTLNLRRIQGLRYGENPHQPGGFYGYRGAAPVGIAAARQLGGKELSFNNLLDLDTAIRLPHEFDRPSAAILKHTTPCGVGLGRDIHEAFINARSTDPQSAFGGIVGFNRCVDGETARAVREGFVEVVVAPDFTEEALGEFRKSKNLRIIGGAGGSPETEMDIRSVLGGVLIQRHDGGFPELEGLKVVTMISPTVEQVAALRFAWITARYAKSNAIVIAGLSRTLGIGAGQMSRVDAAHLAVWKAGQAGLPVAGAVAASDAFFPFPDGLLVLAEAGVKAVIQPGGSVRDAEVVEAADRAGLAMVFTGVRHFRH